MTNSRPMTDYSPRRRALLKAAALSAASAAITPAILTGSAQAAQAAKVSAIPSASLYPAKAFAQTTEAKALRLMYGAMPTAAATVKMTAPDIAENGAVVPVGVDTSLPNVTAVALLALNNPFTMAAAYQIPPGTDPRISSRLKLAKTTQVVAVVKSGDKLFSTAKPVKVTLGGCG